MHVSRTIEGVPARETEQEQIKEDLDACQRYIIEGQGDNAYRCGVSRNVKRGTFVKHTCLHHGVV